MHAILQTKQPFLTFRDQERFGGLQVAYVTLPLMARTPAVVGLMMATLPDASSVAVTSNGMTSMRNESSRSK